MIQIDDYWGNRSIINRIDTGEMFGEAYLAPESGPILNDVVAFKDSTIIFFDVKKILTTCSSACRFHTMVMQNLFLRSLKKTENCTKTRTYVKTYNQRKIDLLFVRAGKTTEQWSFFDSI